MGMNFSPMYQPVSTKTIKADGDLNISPYDLLATDVKCDTVEADEFVGGVGNFTSGLFSNGVQGLLFVKANIGETGSVLYGTCPAISSTYNGANWSLTIPAYTTSVNMPIEHSIGVYTRDVDINGLDIAQGITRDVTFRHGTSGSFTTTTVSYKEASSTEWITIGTFNNGNTFTLTLKTNTEYNFSQTAGQVGFLATSPEKPALYLTYASV